MRKAIELPVAEPIYCTYNYQGSAGAVIYDNPSIRNWYLNQAMSLCCSRRFLYGFTSPEVTIVNSTVWGNPCIFRRS